MAEPLICPPRDVHEPFVSYLFALVVLMGGGNVLLLLPKSPPSPPSFRSPFEYLQDGFWTSDSRFQCLKSKSPTRTAPKVRCIVPRGFEITRWLHRLRQTALDTPTDHALFLPILRQYVYLHLCHHHRSEEYNEELVEELKNYLTQKRGKLRLVAFSYGLLTTILGTLRDAILNTILGVLSLINKSLDLLQDKTNKEGDIEEDTEEDTEGDIEEDGADDTEFLSKKHPLFKISGRTRDSQLLQATQSRDNDALFRIYMPGTKDRLHSTVTGYNKKPSTTRALLQNTEWAEIYIFSASPESAPKYFRYVKIGRSNDPKNRLKQLEHCMPKKFEESYKSDKTQWTKQIEDLVKEDLREFRRLREKCWNSDCGTQHSEWFEYDLQKAIDAVKYWVGWVNKFKPYESDGSLKLRYVRELFNTDIPSKPETKTSPTFLLDSQGECWVDHSHMMKEEDEETKKNKKNKKNKFESSSGQPAVRRTSATRPQPTEVSAAAHLALVQRPNSSPSGHSTNFESSLQVSQPSDVGSHLEPRRTRNSLSGSTRTPKSAAGKLKAQHRLSPSVQDPQSSKSVPHKRSRASSAMQASQSDSNLAPVSGPGVTTGGRSVSDSAVRHVPSKGGRRTSEQFEQHSTHDGVDDVTLPQRVSIAPKPRGNKAGKYHASQAEAPLSVDGSGSENGDDQSDSQTNDEQDYAQPSQSEQEEDDNRVACLEAHPDDIYESDEGSERNRYNDSPRKENIRDDDKDTIMIDSDQEQDTPVNTSPVHEKENSDCEAQEDDEGKWLQTRKDPSSSPAIADPSLPKYIVIDDDSDIEAVEQDTLPRTAKSKSKPKPKSRPSSTRKNNMSTPRKATDTQSKTATTRQTKTAPRRRSQRHSILAKALDTDDESTIEVAEEILNPPLPTQPYSSSPPSSPPIQPFSSSPPAPLPTQTYSSSPPTSPLSSSPLSTRTAQVEASLNLRTIATKTRRGRKVVR